MAISAAKIGSPIAYVGSIARTADTYHGYSLPIVDLANLVWLANVLAARGDKEQQEYESV